jgi:hypothetical protein
MNNIENQFNKFINLRIMKASYILLFTLATSIYSMCPMVIERTTEKKSAIL